MKKFKDFLKQGIPVLIQQGKHSVVKAVHEKGIPVLIQQGKHSLTKKKGVNENVHHAHGVYKNIKSTQWESGVDEFERPYKPTGSPEQIGMERSTFRKMKDGYNLRDHIIDLYQPKLDKLNGDRSVMELHNDLMKHYEFNNDDEQHVKHMIHIGRYTGDSSQLNRALYEEHNKGNSAPRIIDSYGNPSSMHPSEDPYHRYDVHSMDRALHHYTTPHDLHVASGLKFDPGQLMREHGTNKLFLPAYTSTSTTVRTASGFASSFHRNHEHGDQASDYNGGYSGVTHRHILLMHLKKGHPGAYVSHISNHDDEREFILPRRSTVHVNPIAEVHRFSNGKEFHIWHAHQVETESLNDMGVESSSKSTHQVKTPEWSAEKGPASTPTAFGKKVSDPEHDLSRLFDVKTGDNQKPVDNPITLTHTMSKTGAMRIIHNEKSHILSHHTKTQIANLKDGESYMFKNTTDPQIGKGLPASTAQYDMHHFASDHDDIVTDHKATRIGDKVILASKLEHQHQYPGTISTVHMGHFQADHDYSGLKVYSGAEKVTHNPPTFNNNSDVTITHKTFGNKMIVAKGNQSPAYISSGDKLGISKLKGGSTWALDKHMAYKSSDGNDGVGIIHIIPNGDNISDKSVVKIHPSHFEVDHQNLKGFEQHIKGSYTEKPAHLSVKMKPAPSMHEDDR